MATGARTITVIRSPHVDKLAPKPTGEVPEVDITKVVILPRQNYEVERGWVTVEGWDIYILPTSKVQADDGPRRFADGDILSTDTIRIDGVVWSVDGVPAPYDKGKVRKATKVQVKKYGATT
jgi:hypothetical protein